MKRLGKWRALLLVNALLALLAASDVAGRDKKTKDRLYLDSRDVLQVQYRVDSDPQILMYSHTLADNDREWKERMLEEVLEPILQFADFPMEYVVLEDRDKPEKGEPVLKLYVLRWRQTSTGEIEALVQLDLHAYGNRYRIGSYRNDEYPTPGASRTRLEETYKNVVTQSIREALFDLLPSFEEPPAPSEAVE